MDSTQDTIAPSPKPQQRKGPYVPTQTEIDAAISVLQYLPRRKTINPNADTYCDLKRSCEIVSGEYISARAMVLAAMELGFKMRFTKPTGHGASINVSQEAVTELRRRAGLQ